MQEFPDSFSESIPDPSLDPAATHNFLVNKIKKNIDRLCHGFVAMSRQYDETYDVEEAAAMIKNMLSDPLITQWLPEDFVIDHGVIVERAFNDYKQMMKDEKDDGWI
jgi:hypothetical protein